MTTTPVPLLHPTKFDETQDHMLKKFLFLRLVELKKTNERVHYRVLHNDLKEVFSSAGEEAYLKIKENKFLQID